MSFNNKAQVQNPKCKQLKGQVTKTLATERQATENLRTLQSDKKKKQCEQTRKENTDKPTMGEGQT